MGHPPHAVWSYTPRQMSGFGYFAGRRRKQELAETLSIHTAAARGEGQDVKKMHRDLMKDE